ncbi:alginate O-acetyltransferase [Azospira sp. I13]|nr:alginate O-acetyltransferase [Azospira sp. I13]
MASIKQNPAAHPLPDCRNLGVMLRLLLGANLLLAGGALLLAPRLGEWPSQFVELAAWTEPVLFATLGFLALARNWLWHLRPLTGQALVLGLVAAEALLLFDFWHFMGLTEGGWGPALRVALLAVALTLPLLLYFSLRARAFSPAVAEARLQALTARIRPHFLFNSLNAVLSLIRQDPRRAETALEELADLFRALMRDARDLSPLSTEIALCRQYLGLEKLRLGERLKVEWAVADVPDDALVPPLMLQPLLENAVYHGIEPGDGPGCLRIAIARHSAGPGGAITIELTNPSPQGQSHHTGNRMALANIRERLDLYYDLEAKLESSDSQGTYRVRITLPLRRQTP